MKFLIILINLFIIILLILDNHLSANSLNNTQPHHFDKKGKTPSKFTIEKQKKILESLPFDDKLDFEEAKKGFIAAPSYKQIKSNNGNIVWNMESYEFLLQSQQKFASIHPSLQRQAVLNMAYGLYEFVPNNIYQIRGFDIANMTFIKSKKGWIIFDPLTTSETAHAALEFVNKTLGKRPVVAIVYSHSHADHFGGVLGIIGDHDVKSKKIAIIAPSGFMEHAISENIYAGNVMNRRLFFQYGLLLPRNPYGHVDQAIGKNMAFGSVGLIPPTRYIKKDFETLTIDGVTMEFQNTPGTEAPAEMNTYFPQFNAFWAAENITSTIHNIYTLRGAMVRDPLAWSQHINQALYRYGQRAKVMFASHTWPRWGNTRIQDIMRTQRDVYAYLNNRVLHLANLGVTINEIHNVFSLPESLKAKWAAHSYHGSEAHNSRAVINRYLGYWDANPANLTPLSPKDSAPLYVEMMGGAEKIINKAQSLFNEGKYLFAIEPLNKLVYAEPQNIKAKDLLADCYEQIGYQNESASVRNSFLAAAFELRHGIPTGNTPKTVMSNMSHSMPTSLWLNSLAIMLDTKKINNLKILMNLIIPDKKEKFIVEISNSTLTNIQNVQAKNPDITLTINRIEFEKIINGETTLNKLISDKKAHLVGDVSVFNKIFKSLIKFPLNFELIPGTAINKNLYEIDNGF